MPDPDFKVTVARPAYSANGPRVLLDEAHFNVHTSTGSYKTFADLLTSDGYRVVANDRKFSPESLAGAAVLVIANVRGAAMRSETPAFTEAECDAVRDWVQGGGALLLITDHYPTGHNAEALASRLGVAMSKGGTIDPAHAAPGGEDPASAVPPRSDAARRPPDHARPRRLRANQPGDDLRGPIAEGPRREHALLKLGDGPPIASPPTGTSKSPPKGVPRAWL